MNLPTRVRPLGLFLLFVSLAAVLGLAYVVTPFGTPSPTLEEVDQGGRNVVCAGTIDVEGGVANLAPALSGQVVEICVQENHRVNADDVILRLDDREAQHEVQQAQASLDAAEIRLAVAQQESRLHKSRVAQQQALSASARHRQASVRLMLLRQQELLDKSLVSKFVVEATRAQENELSASHEASLHQVYQLEHQDVSLAVRESAANVALAKARLAGARHHVAQCVLRAPAAGSVLRLQVAVGENLPVPGKAAMLFCPERRLVVRAEIEQEFVELITVGQTAHIQDEIASSQVYSGHVTRLAGWFAQQRNLRVQPGQFKDVPTVECLIVFDSETQAFRIGQRVRVTIVVKDRVER
jgi:multidrug resistance efflux pump